MIKTRRDRWRTRPDRQRKCGADDRTGPTDLPVPPTRRDEGGVFAVPVSSGSDADVTYSSTRAQPVSTKHLTTRPKGAGVGGWDLPVKYRGRSG